MIFLSPSYIFMYYFVLKCKIVVYLYPKCVKKTLIKEIRANRISFVMLIVVSYTARYDSIREGVCTGKFSPPPPFLT